MRSERPDVARAYIRYRYKKEIARNYQKILLMLFAQNLKEEILLIKMQM